MIEIAPARRDLIASRLTAGHSVSSTALALEFGVSEDAVRRDLRALAAHGVCRRVYGGALPLQPASSSMVDRMSEAMIRKHALALAALSFIDPGSFLFMDNGSTNLVVAKSLPKGHDLTVATNSIAIAAALAAREDIQVIMVGGAVDALIGGCVDATAIESVSRLNPDTCFLGACSLSSGGGVSAFEAADADFKRVLVARSRQLVVLATNEKLGRQAPHRIAALGVIDWIVIEHDAPPERVVEIEATGATVRRAEPCAPLGAG